MIFYLVQQSTNEQLTDKLLEDGVQNCLQDGCKRNSQPILSFQYVYAVLSQNLKSLKYKKFHS
jgi:hypothetical protein